MASNYYTSVEQFVAKRIYKEKLPINPDVILNDPTLRAQAEEMMHQANEERRQKWVQQGKENGSDLGERWKKFMQENPEQAIQISSKGGTATWNSMTEEEQEQKMQSLRDGNHEWYNSLSEEQKQYYIDTRIGGFKAWAQANPEKAKANASKAGQATAQRAKENPELFIENGRKAGKKGGAATAKWQKENPEQAAKNLKKACDAAAIVNSQKKQEAIKQLYAILPNEFMRLEAREIAKQNGIRQQAANHIIEDPTLVEVIVIPKQPGEGRGGRKKLYRKIVK